MKLQIFLQKSGVASRRKCAEYIENNKVKVNGETIDVFWYEVDPFNDVVEYEGKKLSLIVGKKYYLFNKPEGYICANSDPFKSKTIFDYIREKYGIMDNLHSVGRLDKNTSGLIILTNDGYLTNKIIHPGNKIDKLYLATVKGTISDIEKKEFETGLLIDNEYTTSPAKLDIIRILKNNNSVIEITIHEGRKRQVRLMCKAVGHEVISLKRLKIGCLDLSSINKTGDIIEIKEEQIYSRMGFDMKGRCSK